MKPNKKQIMAMMEQLQNGSPLIFHLPATFGGGVALIELNPEHDGKKQKKYLMRLGKSEDQARIAQPFWETDKSKKLAGWVVERLGEIVIEDVKGPKAA